MQTTNHLLTSLQHPLDPLSEDEIKKAIELIKTSGREEGLRFVSVSINEPSKEIVLDYKEGDPVVREAKIILLNNSDGTTHEAIVSITQEQILSWRLLTGVQPPITLDEFAECEKLVKDSQKFQEALKKRGVANFDLVMVDPWSAGNYGVRSESGRRLLRALSWVRAAPRDNGYARPIEGVVAVVDLNKKEVIAVEDYGVIPLPPDPGNYTADMVGPLRSDLKPLEIHQPEGPSFRVSGHRVNWQKWDFRIGFTPREGLVLYTVGYEDKGRIRPVLYRASISEMVIPYGDPAPTHRRKNAFDEGEYGLGMLTNSLELNCDCLGEIHYFDATIANVRGEVVTLRNAVCMHEEDFGILWKHKDWRTGDTEVRRSRRLVVSFIATVSNYEYGFYWYFYQDGSIEFQVKLTGILSTGAIAPGRKPKYGRLVARQLYGPIHQHFFNVRLDLDIDGRENDVYEVHAESAARGKGNPFNGAFFQKYTLLKRELDGQQCIDPLRAKSWKIVNPTALNTFGEPVGYRLVPGDNVLPFAQPGSSILKRATFMAKHFWVTPYSPNERYAAGEYPNQHGGGDGLPRWTKRNRRITKTDVVVWYSIGHHHMPRPEDWPVVPVSCIGFSLKPDGFFDSNPALDVPPAAKSGPGSNRCH